ncbi:MAG: hypothetical protein RBT49_19065, partial [Bacteroidales bacterium]|nr:hypothetical protein [Bacteroidales bacterium]
FLKKSSRKNKFKTGSTPYILVKRMDIEPKSQVKTHFLDKVSNKTAGLLMIREIIKINITQHR